MRLSIARGSAGGHTADRETPHDTGSGNDSTAWRGMALALSAVLILGGVGILFASSKPAGADTVYQSGEVIASVGQGSINGYDPTSGTQTATLDDGTGDLFNLGTRLRRQRQPLRDGRLQR